MRLSAISHEEAVDYMKSMGSSFRGPFTGAIAVRDAGTIHGVIVFTADGKVCRKEQITTDGSAHIGSLLYGGLVRAAMALGYDSLTF